MSTLVDTNVLLRRTQRESPDYSAAVQSVAALLRSGETVCFTPQVIAEFWSVATRPANKNGLGLSVAATLYEVTTIEQDLTLLADNPDIYPEWKRLVHEYKVLGSKVHDTRLVAAMNVHGVRRILTFNGGDFARFPVEVIHPATLVG